MKYTLIFLISFCVIYKLSESSTYMKTVKMECYGYPKYFFANHSCRLRPLNRYKTIANMDAYLKTTLRNVSANIALLSRNDANIYRPFLVNSTHNMCQWLKGKSYGAYLGYLMKILKKYTNINHTCPLTGILSARDIFMDTSIIPVPLPKNSYKFQISFYEGYPLEDVGIVSFFIDILENRH